MHLVELDSRRRVALGKLGRAEHTRYLAEDQADGTIILTPAVVMTANEVALLRQPGVVARVEAELAEPETWVRDSTARRAL